MALHLFDDVLLLDLSLEAAKGVFECFALLKLYFSQPKYTSLPPKFLRHSRGRS
jgi:hypothetical protein